MTTTLTQAWQSWRFARSVLALAAAALAIGIGATTAVYTIVNAVMVKPLPYEHGERFGLLLGGSTRDPNARGSLQFEDAVRYQQETRSFDVFGWYRPEAYNITAPGSPRHVEGAAVTLSLAHHLGVAPVLGNWFQDQTGAVISTALWNALGGSPAIVGQRIVLNGRAFTITGVMPPRFRMPEIGHDNRNTHNDVWIALDATGRAPGSGEGGFFFAYARLKPGVTFAQAEADVQRVAAAIAAAAPFSHPGYTARFDSLRELIIKPVRPTLIVLLAAATLLFLVGCANVSALLLARSVARLRETAVRVALGASKGALARQFFAEGLIVAGIGAIAGVLVSVGLVRIVVAMAADLIPRAHEVSIDWRVLLFTMVTGLLASAIASLAPLWQALRTQPNEVLADGVRVSAGARSRRLSNSLVIAELAVAVTLLSVSVLLLLHVRQLSRVPAGFDIDHLLTFQLTLPDAVAQDEHRRVPQQKRFIEALRAIPGVQGVGIANQTPLNGCCVTTAVFPEGVPADLSKPQRIGFLPVNPEFFETLRLPMRRGRLLTYADAGVEPIPVVINEATARTYWPGREALGAFGHLSVPDGTRFQVVGVIGDVRNDLIDKPTVPEIFVLFVDATPNPAHFFVRSALPPSTLLPAVRRAILSVDPAQPIHDEATLDQIVLTSLSLQRLATVMTGFFAMAALVMAALGIYGVMAYSVRQRTIEFGTRMALGAVARDILTLVLGGGLKIAAVGVMLGFVAVIIVTRWLTQVLELPAMGWLPFTSAALTMGALALIASLVPAWRASRLSPMVAIRNDAGPLWIAPRLLRRALVTRETGEARAVPSSALFVEATRAASSPAEALQLALATLATKLDAEWVMLVDDVDDVSRGGIRADATGVIARTPLAGTSFLTNRLQFHDDALPIAAADLDAWLEWARQFRPQHVDEIEQLRAAGARLAVPLRMRKAVTGILLLGAPISHVQQHGREAYTSAERQALREGARQLALMVENTRLASRILEQEFLRRDLALAAEVQKRLLPEHPPPAGVATLAAFTIAARNLGGDYYDFLKVGDRCLAIALADVSGKGVAAALIMSVVQASLRIISSDETVPPKLLAARMNEFLHRSTQSKSYATFFFARIDEQTRQMDYVNAGHNPPFLLRADADTDAQPAITELNVGGMVLGLFPDVDYDQASIDLQSGDVLLIFSDGVTEALNVSGEEFGESRLRQLLIDHHHASAQDLANEVAANLRTWTTGAPPHDDVTFVVMRVT
jgi:putative ABC transport system permease protein